MLRGSSSKLELSRGGALGFPPHPGTPSSPCPKSGNNPHPGFLCAKLDKVHVSP